MNSRICSAGRQPGVGLDEFIAWFAEAPRPSGFTKATVTAWRVALEARRLGPISINVRITAVRKLAVEAADNGLLAPELAAGIARIKGVRSHGVRVGNWLSLRQAQALLNAPDVRTKKGLRDRSMFATLLGCGLRRSELANLTMKHVQVAAAVREPIVPDVVFHEAVHSEAEVVTGRALTVGLDLHADVGCRGGAAVIVAGSSFIGKQR
jgi:integrase